MMKLISRMTMLLVLLFFLLACASPGEVPDTAPPGDEIPEGPGILTGEKGAWEITF
ncbi:hypothetical protein [Motiliproteus sp. MSK22-1]|uniref:hypothetical protein n=1 Tax=Motiliproteus sp. MSK22-1 TaxID=1897630 RepID=UPI00130152F3|nr:hypothetical protein [Motiliproteus sp. MSK22-1]